jgi:hypothetical protein
VRHTAIHRIVFCRHRVLVTQRQSVEDGNVHAGEACPRGEVPHRSGRILLRVVVCFVDVVNHVRCIRALDVAKNVARIFIRVEVIVVVVIVEVGRIRTSRIILKLVVEFHSEIYGSCLRDIRVRWIVLPANARHIV